MLSISPHTIEIISKDLVTHSILKNSSNVYVNIKIIHIKKNYIKIL